MLRSRDVNGAGRRGGELDPRPSRELAARPDGPADALGYLVERHREYVVQNERDALPRTQMPEHFEQRAADLVVEGDAVGGVVDDVNLDEGRLLLRPHLRLESRACRPELVEAQAP